jgi:hypothetical protein
VFIVHNDIIEKKIGGVRVASMMIHNSVRKTRREIVKDRGGRILLKWILIEIWYQNCRLGSVAQDWSIGQTICLPFHLKTETNPVSETSFSGLLEYRTMYKVPKFNDSVTHHRQNPLKYYYNPSRNNNVKSFLLQTISRLFVKRSR